MIIDTLQLADGTKIDVRTGKPERPLPPSMVVMPNAFEAVERVSKVKMRLSDLPAPPKQMNVISVIVLYSMMGMSDTEIGIALNMTEAQVSRLRVSDVALELRRNVTDTVLSNDTDDVRSLFQQHSKNAAASVLHVMQYAEKDKDRLAAAQDILDRAGHRPVDVHEHRISVEGGLKIEYVERKPLDVGGVVIEGDTL